LSNIIFNIHISACKGNKKFSYKQIFLAKVQKQEKRAANICVHAKKIVLLQPILGGTSIKKII
jgi:hypothetical protein